MNKNINTDRFSSILRNRGINHQLQKVLITKFFNTLQDQDLSLPPNCGGYGRIHHFKRFISENWPLNPLPIDPACHALNTPLCDEMKVQLFQNAICSWRCWYCFVDDKLLSGNQSFADFKTADELIDLYLNEKEFIPIIDISGGQPDLVPEWTTWLLKSIENRGLKEKVYVWSDDNLSNDYLWRYLSKDEIDYLKTYKYYGRVGCFKGFDEASFSFNTKAEPNRFLLQFDLMRKLVEEGFDVYGYLTLTHYDDKNLESKLMNFVDLLQEKVHPLFPLRTVPLKIKKFTPTLKRMSEQNERAISIQQLAVNFWQDELRKRFSPSELNRPIYENRI